MKQLLFTLFISLTISTSAQSIFENQESSDTLSQEKKEAIILLTEQVLLEAIDSIAQEGMYMRAIDLLDSIQANWKKMTGKEPSPMVYIKKGNYYLHMEEWQQLIDVTTECINNNKESMTNKMMALIYSMQASGYSNLDDYKKAIRSYESEIGYYSTPEDYGSQGAALCNIANCYDKLGKASVASSFYEKGLMKYLQYFNITKKQLIKSNFKVDDPNKEATFELFAVHLYSMAVFEQNNGDRQTSKEYLLMSAHCGDSMAQSEYQRIYGGY